MTISLCHNITCRSPMRKADPAVARRLRDAKPGGRERHLLVIKRLCCQRAIYSPPQRAQRPRDTNPFASRIMFYRNGVRRERTENTEACDKWGGLEKGKSDCGFRG